LAGPDDEHREEHGEEHGDGRGGCDGCDSPEDSEDSGGPEGCEDLGESAEERQTGRPVPYPVRLGHALMDLLERLPGDLLPTTGSAAALVRVTIDYDRLTRDLGAATLDTDTELSVGQARRLACESAIMPIVLDGDSQPLDVGRARRTHTKHQREAMSLRDRGCKADGCTVPPDWCQAHHPQLWSEGGPTSLENGVLLCSYHHHLIHHSRWHTYWAHDKIHFRKHPR
jgi:hypothetical protein